MTFRLICLVRLSRKRARTQAGHLNVLMKRFRSDPESNFHWHSQAAELAKRVSHHLRQAERAGRIILTSNGARRQLFLVDVEARHSAGHKQTTSEWRGSEAPAGLAAAHSQPTKQQVRDWLLREVAKRAPPPSIGEIKRELWGRC